MGSAWSNCGPDDGSDPAPQTGIEATIQQCGGEQPDLSLATPWKRELDSAPWQGRRHGLAPWGVERMWPSPKPALQGNRGGLIP